MAIYRPFGSEQACDFGFDITTLWYLTEPNSTVFRGIARGNILGFVGRAKVNDDEFEVSKALAEDAFDRLGQKSLYIASYHHDGNERVISCRHGMPFEPVVTHRALKLNP